VNSYRINTEVLIIGSGIAGSMAALTLAENGTHVTLLTAGEDLFSGNTRLAQGGIVFHSEDDDPGILEKDILTAGWRQNSLRAVRYLCHKGRRFYKKRSSTHITFPLPTAMRTPGTSPKRAGTAWRASSTPPTTQA